MEKMLEVFFGSAAVTLIFNNTFPEIYVWLFGERMAINGGSASAGGSVPPRYMYGFPCARPMSVLVAIMISSVETKLAEIGRLFVLLSSQEWLKGGLLFSLKNKVFSWKNSLRVQIPMCIL